MDPGDQVVNLQFVPSLFGLSSDQQRYYFMHRNSGELTVFDLEGKKLIKKIQFEKEGPNSIPGFVSNFQLFDDNHFLLTGFRIISTYDSAGKKLTDIPFDKEKFPDLTDVEGYSLQTGLKANERQELFFSLPSDSKIKRVSLAIWDNSSSQSRLVPLPEFGFLTKFTLEFREGDNYSGAGFASLNLKLEENRLLAFSSGTTSIYTYDLSSDSLVFKTYTPSLVPAQAEVPAISEFTSRQAFDEAISLARSQIFFGDPLWDENRGIYLRFASITKPNANPELPAKSEVFLLAFDKGLNLIGESTVEELPSQPVGPSSKTASSGPMSMWRMN